MTVRGEIVPTGQARGARLVARGKSRAFDWKFFAPSLWPRASRPKKDYVRLIVIQNTAAATSCMPAMMANALA